MPVDRDSSSLQLRHPKGASAQILLYGATVISWKAASPTDAAAGVTERIFVSSKAALDGSKAVRGGIPICFPIFGPPTKAEHSKLSQHGFARTAVWTYEKTVLDNEAGVSVQLSLTPKAVVLSKYPFPCKLLYTVTLAEHQLTTHLHVENIGTDSLSFQALLHTYHRVPAAATTVTPLKGLSYINKVKSGEVAIENRDGVDVREFTDSIYLNANGDYEIVWDGKPRIQIRAHAFPDVVVWNPAQEAGSKLNDMEDGGWEHFICVEPGAASSFIILSAGEKWDGQQVLTVL